MKRFTLFLSLASVVVFTADVSAQLFRGSSRRAAPQRTSVPRTVYSAPATISPAPSMSSVGTNSVVNTSYYSGGAQEALDEVNATRASRGLPPYIRDPGLTQAAMTIAQQRASQLIAGHTSNDFAGVPAGTSASASGCAAWPASMGWGSCCTYDRYTYAGAAWATGRDGRRYMQLFVR